MTELNIPLLRKVVEHAETHPEEFDMDSWFAFYKSPSASEPPVRMDIEADWLKSEREEELHRPLCDTTMCAAGTAVWLVGGTLGPRYGWCSTPDGNEGSVPLIAKDLLGLTDSQAGRIFYSGVTTGQQLRAHIEFVLGVTL
jgi:hypothetical protein